MGLKWPTKMNIIILLLFFVFFVHVKLTSTFVNLTIDVKTFWLFFLKSLFITFDISIQIWPITFNKVVHTLKMGKDNMIFNLKL